MANLSNVTTRNSRVSQAGSSKSGSKTRGKFRFFSAIKQVFSPSSDSEKLSRTKSRRGSSSAWISSSEREKQKEAVAEQEREARRASCMAIKMAKREPLAVQKLLVDCEFCNPPPEYGRILEIVTPQFTAEDNPGAPSPNEIEEVDDERTWNVGLDEWLKLREWWLKKTDDAIPIHRLDPDVGPDKFYAVYDKIIHHTRPLKEPLSLDDMVKIVRSGWIAEGTWPANTDPADVWSETDVEEATKKMKQTSLENKPSSETRRGHEFKSAVSSLNESSTNRASEDRSPSPPVKSRNLPELRVTSGTPDPETGISGDHPHVQFSERPHPRDNSGTGLPPLERMQSSMTSVSNLSRVRSAASSLVSMTDSD